MLKQAEARTIMPRDGLPPMLKRRPQRDGEVALAPGTIVVSADNHMSLAADLWYERFPERLKDRAPRVWREGAGGFQFGSKDKPLLPPQFRMALDLFEPLPGASSEGLEARMADLAAEGIQKELVFPNGIQCLFALPDLEIRDLCFRIYNEYAAELQGRFPGRFYPIGLINWWDAKGTRTALKELKALGLKTFLLPMKASAVPGAPPIDWTASAMTPVWAEIEDAGLPVSHHIGESPQITEYNFLPIGMVFNAGTFREMFCKYIFGGILDRHPSLRVGWFEGGINWVVSTLQDADHAYASYRSAMNLAIKHEPAYYWHNHMFASFMVDPLGLELIDRIGVDRVLWSADYPHTESTFGYSRSSLQQVVDMIGPERARDVVGGNAIRLFGL